MRSPECPRCGYDLSGKLDGYRESCPLEDMCTECAHAFRWSHAVDAWQASRWCYEMAPTGRAFVATALRLAVPYMLFQPQLGERSLERNRLIGFAIRCTVVSMVGIGMLQLAIRVLGDLIISPARWPFSVEWAVYLPRAVWPAAKWHDAPWMINGGIEPPMTFVWPTGAASAVTLVLVSGFLLARSRKQTVGKRRRVFARSAIYVLAPIGLVTSVRTLGEAIVGVLFDIGLNTQWYRVAEAAYAITDFPLRHFAGPAITAVWLTLFLHATQRRASMRFAFLHAVATTIVASLAGLVIAVLVSTGNPIMRAELHLEDDTFARKQWYEQRHGSRPLIPLMRP